MVSQKTYTKNRSDTRRKNKRVKRRNKSNIQKRKMENKTTDGSDNDAIIKEEKQQQSKTNSCEKISNSNPSSPSKKNSSSSSDYNLYINVGVICITIITIATIITVYTMKDSKTNTTAVNIIHVWAYSWMTAVCTGLGAVPFFMIDNVNDFWLGICNALAGGMMIAASFVLLYEGAADGNGDFNAYDVNLLGITLFKMFVGFIFGVGFVRFCRKRLAQYQNLMMGNLDGLEARKVLLVVGVMTIHSLSEGVGIGVAFSGQAGLRLGSIVSSTLAVHNIPEGLAIALVLVPKGISAKGAVVWSIFSSIPQPIMAVPTYLFVAQMLHVLPIGLGFAAGAMLDVAGMELLPEAFELINNRWLTVVVTIISSVFMLCSQLFLSG